jgi:rRNA-processing protein FCF1
MELTELRVGFPLLKLNVCVHHATPRPPTAFERVLLNICDRFGSDTTYNNIPLERIFLDILGVADPFSLVGATLQELVALDVLRCQGDIESLDTLILRDMAITDRGRHMMSEDMLPAKSMEKYETFFFDPVRKRLLSDTEAKTYRPLTPTISVDSSIFQELFPEEQIRSQILHGGYPWWSPASKIERVERQSVSVFWREMPARIVIEEGHLQIVFKDSEQTTYINSLNAEDIYRRFIEPVLVDNRCPAANLSETPLGSIEDGDAISAKYMPLPQALNEFPTQARVWLVDSASGLVACPEQAGAQQAIVVFDQSDGSEHLVVKWNKTRNGCLLTVRGAYPLQDVLIASEQHIVRGRRVRVEVGRENHELLLVLRVNGAEPETAIRGTLAHIATLLRKRGGEEDELVPALWEHEEAFWHNFQEHLASSALSLIEQLQLLQQARKRVGELGGVAKSDTWDRTVVRIVCNHLQGGSIVSADQLGGLVISIARCKVNSPDLMASAVAAVRDRVRLPETLEELSKIASAFKQGGPVWQIPFPSPIYTPNVMKAVANGFSKANLAEALVSDNGFDKAIHQLLRTYQAINSAVGGKGIDGLSSEESYIALLKSPNVMRIAELADAWRNQYSSFCSACRDMEAYLPGSSLSFANEHIITILRWSRKLAGGLDPKYNLVCVFDTSALLSQPGILSSVRPNEFVVVTKRVLEELDDKKGDETLRPKVAEATRFLQGFPKQQIQFSDGDMSLLSADYRMKGDNLILSVAVRYRKHKPVLITNDKNLTLKANAEGIAAMSANEFVKRPRKNAPGLDSPKNLAPDQRAKHNPAT